MSGLLSFSKTAPNLFLHFSRVANKEKEDAFWKLLFKKKKGNQMTLPQIRCQYHCVLFTAVVAAAAMFHHIYHMEEITQWKIHVTLLAPN